MPLLIGGATTSRAHTAVKIEPAYSGPVVHVQDASRAVGVAGALLNANAHDDFVEKTRAEYAEVRRAHAGRTATTDAAPDASTQARANRVHARLAMASRRRGRPSWARAPSTTSRSRSWSSCIDWTPFFAAWELRRPLPRDPRPTRSSARPRPSSVRRRAEAAAAESSTERLLRANAVVGFWPANATPDDDIVRVHRRDANDGARPRFHALRQQMADSQGADRPNVALVRLRGAASTSGVADYIGAFAVTAGVGLEEARAKFEAAATTTTTRSCSRRSRTGSPRRSPSGMHEKVRRELWGYAPDESLDNDALIAEAYQGIRPAPGYPACPDHTEKRTDLRRCSMPSDAPGITLTESMAMLPGARRSAAGISGIPQSRYFGLGRIGRDQLEDYARRKGWTLDEAARWLAPNLGED